MQETNAQAAAKPNPVAEQRRCRMGVIDTAFLAIPGEQTDSVEVRWSTEVSDVDQLWKRRLLATEDEWKPIDKGWVDEPSMIILQNEEGKNLQVRQTQEQVDELKARVVEVSLRGDGTADLLVPPLDSVRFRAVNLDRVRVRCAKGKALCKVSVFPK